MPDNNNQTKEVPEKVYRLLNEKLEKIQAEYESILKGKAFAELDYEQQIKICQYKKLLKEQHGHCLEAAIKAKFFEIAPSHFISIYSPESAVTKYYLQRQNNEMNILQEKKVFTSVLNSADELFVDGIRNLLGLGIIPNFEEAVRLLILAAEQGSADAQSDLGQFYYYGIKSVVENKEEALRWWTLAAEQNNTNAMNNLGSLYFNYVKNKEKAVLWWTLAAELGHEDAENSLGTAYFFGDGGLPEDKKEAVHLWTLAVEQGNLDALNNLAAAYCYGHGGLTEDKKEAVQLWRLAVEKGNVKVKKNLINMQTPLATYTNAILEKNNQLAAQLLIDNVDLRQDFLNDELDKALTEENGIDRLQNILDAMLKKTNTSVPDINSFMINVLLVFYEKKRNLDNNHAEDTAKLMQLLFDAINPLDVQQEHIQPLMELIADSWWNNETDFSGLELLKALWHRAESIHQILDSSLRRQVALMLIKHYSHNEYTLNMEEVSNYQLALLFILDSKDIEALDQLGIEILLKKLINKTSLVKLLPKLNAFLANKEYWGQEKSSLLIQQIENYLSLKLASKDELLDEFRALEIFNCLSDTTKQISSGFFAIEPGKEKEQQLLKLLRDKNTEKLLNYIDQAIKPIENHNTLDSPITLN